MGIHVQRVGESNQCHIMCGAGSRALQERLLIGSPRNMLRRVAMGSILWFSGYQAETLTGFAVIAGLVAVM